jgi:hypothetical protein
MVLISEKANNDLRKILSGLLSWQRISLNREYCLNYVPDIITVCRSIDKRTIHFNAIYSAHKQYGQKYLNIKGAETLPGTLFTISIKETI